MLFAAVDTIAAAGKPFWMMTDEQRVPGAADDRGEKRKCDDFTALYPMDNATATPTPQAPAQPRNLTDPTGKST